MTETSEQILRKKVAETIKVCEKYGWAYGNDAERTLEEMGDFLTEALTEADKANADKFKAFDEACEKIKSDTYLCGDSDRSIHTNQGITLAQQKAHEIFDFDKSKEAEKEAQEEQIEDDLEL